MKEKAKQGLRRVSRIFVTALCLIGDYCMMIVKANSIKERMLLALGPLLLILGVAVPVYLHYKFDLPMAIQAKIACVFSIAFVGWLVFGVGPHRSE